MTNLDFRYAIGVTVANEGVVLWIQLDVCPMPRNGIVHTNDHIQHGVLVVLGGISYLTENTGAVRDGECVVRELA